MPMDREKQNKLYDKMRKQLKPFQTTKEEREFMQIVKDVQDKKYTKQEEEEAMETQTDLDLLEYNLERSWSCIEDMYDIDEASDGLCHNDGAWL